jgi:hypothetical protein
MRRLEMHKGTRIIVSHISGEGMKAPETDGVSRGHLKEGVYSKNIMLAYIPFHLMSIQRSPAVENWLQSWLGENMEVLAPDIWFKRSHNILGDGS